jgi:penicillin G amidase
METFKRADTAWILPLLKGELNAEEVAVRFGITRPEMEERQRLFLESKLPRIEGVVAVCNKGGARIRRDRWGVAHVEADRLEDGYFALGYAMGQDRLWQLDYLRRRVRGRLAELFGRSRLGSDRLMRTIGLGTAAEKAVEQLTQEEAAVLQALADGINVAGEEARDHLPLEFELLEYEPESWQISDSIALWKWRWWMLTGRLDLIALEEACKRHLPEELRQAFMQVEAGEETIVPGTEPVGATGHDVGEGSNNWVVGGSRTPGGRPILATDPHNAIDYPSQWYEAQLTVPGIDAIGAFYLGTPGIYLGHTRHTAWGVTNHTSSGRDLYLETLDDKREAYLEAEMWTPLEVERQEIQVRGEEAVHLEICRTARGPIINDFVTSVVAEGDPPLSLRWAGSQPATGFASMLKLMRSTSLDDIRDALRCWPFPNLNFVFADSSGRIGYQAVGTVPRRFPFWSGFRPAGEPEHQWEGAWGFDELPQLIDPERDWVATANNSPWRGSGPYISLGNWSDGYRFRRIRERIEGQEKLDMAAVAAIQADVQHARGRELGGALAVAMRQSTIPKIRELADLMEAWDGSYGVRDIGPTLFEAFWNRWLERVATVRFPAHLVTLVTSRAGGVARRLLLGEAIPWFPATVDVSSEIEEILRQVADWLHSELGGDTERWRWGELHQVRFPHPLGAQSPTLEELLSPGPFPTSGGTGTVRAAGISTAEPFRMTGGSTYRMVVDMARPEHAWSTTTGGSSGHPGSHHYDDQVALWLEDRYHPLRMEVEAADIEGTLELQPV